MKLTKEEVRHIAKLARLELGDDELELYGSQLSGVLDYIDQLRLVDTSSIQPTAQVTGLHNIWREDAVNEWDKSSLAEAIAQAPDLEDNQYKVKRVIK